MGRRERLILFTDRLARVGVVVVLGGCGSHVRTCVCGVTSGMGPGRVWNARRPVLLFTTSCGAYHG